MLERYRRLFAKIKRRLLSRHLVLARLVTLGAVLFAVFALFFGLRRVAFETGFDVYVKMASNFLFLPDSAVKETEGRTNILLLGKAGEDPVLTDTMLLLSVGRRGEDTVLVSIPRDIWIPEFSDKINSVYWRGNEKGAGGGTVLTKSVVEEILGVPVHYAAAFDFEGFVEVVDKIGGIDVEVDKSFTDLRYPIAGKENEECGPPAAEASVLEYACRYETVSFEKGVRHMDGETALKFARSRHSEDPEEGTDFARARRQQKVLVAVKNKITSREIIFAPRKLASLWSTFNSIFETDLTKPQLAYISRLMYDSRGSIGTYTLPEEFLFNPPYSEEYNNLYVFIPRSGDWGQAHRWVQDIF